LPEIECPKAAINVGVLDLNLDCLAVFGDFDNCFSRASVESWVFRFSNAQIVGTESRMGHLNERPMRIVGTT
jgi:hypothetical protein